MNKIGQQGFTLPELALVLVLSGASLLATAQFANIYNENTRYIKTIENLEMIYDALEEYAGLNGYYPCPADPGLDPSNANYGISQCRDINNANFSETDCTYSISGVECETIGSRDGVAVLIGAIPFKTLIDGISDTPIRGFHKTDGYGALITYAVTERLTETYTGIGSGLPYENLSIDNPFNPLMGAIAVLDENLNPIMDPEKEGQFVIFSHGRDGVGGHSPQGKEMENCFVPSTTGGSPGLPTPGPHVPGSGKI